MIDIFWAWYSILAYIILVEISFIVEINEALRIYNSFMVGCNGKFLFLRTLSNFAARWVVDASIILTFLFCHNAHATFSMRCLIQIYLTRPSPFPPLSMSKFVVLYYILTDNPLHPLPLPVQLMILLVSCSCTPSAPSSTWLRPLFLNISRCSGRVPKKSIEETK